MTERKPLQAIVVGCGSIGALKSDKYDKPYGDTILTHAHAYKVSPDVDLCCVVDVVNESAAAAAKKWQVPYETDIVRALAEYKPDIISLCVPTKEHFRLINTITQHQHKVKLIIGEKPFCQSLTQAKAARKLCADNGIAVLINYTRRYSLEYTFLKRQIDDNEFGKVYHARLLYGRGLLRDGCHGLDIFNWFFGRLKGIIVKNLIYDYLPDDPTVGMHLEYDKCIDVQMVAVDSRKYGVFEMEFVTDRGIIRLAENGRWLYFYEAEEEKIYGGYKSLPANPKDARITDLTNTLSWLIVNAAGYILRKEKLICTVDDAITVHEIIEAIKQVNIETEKRRKANE